MNVIKTIIFSTFLLFASSLSAQDVYSGNGLSVKGKCGFWSCKEQCKTTSIKVNGYSNGSVITGAGISYTFNKGLFDFNGPKGYLVRNGVEIPIVYHKNWLQNVFGGLFGVDIYDGMEVFDFNGQTNPNGEWSLKVCSRNRFRSDKLEVWKLYLSVCGNGNRDCTNYDNADSGCRSNQLYCSNRESCDSDNQDCNSIDPKFYRGQVGRSCNNSCSGYNDLTANCKYCGDGVVSPEFGEECEAGSTTACSNLLGNDYLGDAVCGSKCKWDTSVCNFPSQRSENKVVAIRHFTYAHDATSLPNAALNKISAEDLDDQSICNEYDDTEGGEFGGANANKCIDTHNNSAVKKPYGWWTSLPRDTLYPEVSGETIMIGSPAYCANKLYFTAYVKHKINKSTPINACKIDLSKDKMGWSYLFEVYAFNGKPVKNRNDIFNDDRIAIYLGRGMASEPTCVDGDVIWNAPGDPNFGDEPVPFMPPRDPDGSDGSSSEEHVAPTGTGGLDADAGLQLLWWKVD